MLEEKIRAKPELAAAQVARILSREASVGVIGLGYVGLPLARALNDAGFKVVGFDVDSAKPEMLRQGQTYIKHLPAEIFSDRMVQGTFDATTDFSRVGEVDALLICVPTPLTKNREPDLSCVVQTAESIAPFLRVGQLVILESTTYPGTSRELMIPILEKSGLKCGTDFFVAFSPEREDPGNPLFGTTSIPKVVGADDAGALAIATALYEQFVTQVVPVSSLDTAEAVKITENIFRSVNIALVNELKQIYTALGIDIWEVIEAAKSKPFGYMAFYPGPGLGGHCIPIDPFYLTWKAREHDIPTRFIELAGEINTSMPAVVVARLVDQLSDRFSKSVNGAKILLVGLAYKKNVDDIRESPGFRLIELLEARGATVEFYDPFVPVVPMTREHAALAGRRSIELVPSVLNGFDAALIGTDHDGVDYGLIVKNVGLVVDTRNAVARAGFGDAPNVCKA